MKIHLKGGLGNQMFQYAYGRKLELSGKKIAFDISFFYGNKSGKDTERVFGLNHFNLETKAQFLKKNKENLFEIICHKIQNKIWANNSFYQSEKYFKEIDLQIRKEFTLKNPLSQNAEKILEQIKNNQNSISIHIRRGDYVNNPETNKYHGTCSLEYYEKAINLIKEKNSPQTPNQMPNFYIFTDDPKWAKENLKIENAVFVSDFNLEDYEEMFLMSKCKHNIIANSTFSWWGAWLNEKPDKIVIAPKKWIMNAPPQS